MDYTQRLRDLRADHEAPECKVGFDRQEGSAWSPLKSTSG